MLGDTALATLASATPVVTLVFSFGMGITNGMGILLSGQLAKKDIVGFLVWGYLFNAVTQCFMGRINSYGQPRKGMVIIVINHIAIRIPFSIILSNTVLGLDGIWITLLFSFVVAFACAFIIDRQIIKKQCKQKNI